MKKWTFYAGSALLATLMLAGCGSDSTEDEPKDKQEEAAPKDTQENNSSDQEQGTKNEKIRLMEQNLQYTLDGKMKEETAFLKKSDNQPFSLYVLQDYDLSAEEPGKDIVFLKDDDSVYMRMELLDQANWDEVEQNAKDQLQTISDKLEDPGLDIANGTAYEVSTTEGEVVTSILLKDEKAPMRLTLFTKKNQDYRNAFLEMAKTAEKE